MGGTVQGICIWLRFFIGVGLLITQCQGESVSLTVEGGVSLVGEHCPGTIRLFCNATELSSLRLRYNGNMQIVTFFPDSTPMTRTDTGNPAFLSVDLTSVTRNAQSANYSTYLTVDLDQLQAENIMNISCGNPDVLEIEQVDVIMKQQVTPDTPIIKAVSVTYQWRLLTFLEVTWEKIQNVCSAYASSSGYQVILNGSNPVQMETNYSRCGEVDCTARFTNLTDTTGQYEITIVAFNEVGLSSPAVYPNAIEKGHPQNLLSVVSMNFTTDCLIVGHCALEDGFNTTCTLRYTNDSTYNDFSNSTTHLSNKQFNISGLLPGTTYYFEFSFSANNRLHIIDRLQTTTQAKTSCDFRQPSQPVTISIGAVIGIAVSVIVTVVFLVITCSVLGIIFLRQKGNKSVEISVSNGQNVQNQLTEAGTQSIHETVIDSAGTKICVTDMGEDAVDVSLPNNLTSSNPPTNQHTTIASSGNDSKDVGNGHRSINEQEKQSLIGWGLSYISKTFL